MPMSATRHGNDFISPWTAHNAPWLGTRDGGCPTCIPLLSWSLAQWRRKAVHRGLRSAIGLVANSCYTRDHCIAEVGLRLDPLAVVAPGIDDRHFEARRRTVTVWPFRLAWFFGRRDRLSKVTIGEIPDS